MEVIKCVASSAMQTRNREHLPPGLKLLKPVCTKGSAFTLKVNVKEESSYTKVNYGAPQGSVLGPVLFTLYMLLLGSIITRHSRHYHCCADDTHLYLSIKPHTNELNWPSLSGLYACLAGT